MEYKMTTQVHETRRAMAIKVLGFDPYTQEYGSWFGPNGEKLYELTPTRAAYLLKYHNFNNRDFKAAQLIALSESIGLQWFNDGDALRLDKNGDTPEFQHRLKIIVQRNITVYVPLVLGVEPDAWTQTAKAATRTNYDEIWRKDNSITKDEVSTLSEIISRRSYMCSMKNGAEELKLPVAASLWFHYKDTVREGEKLTEDFFKKTSIWNPWRRVFAAWAGLMWKNGKGADATIFLNMLKDATLKKDASALGYAFKTFWEQEEVSYLKNTERPRVIWFMLCKAADRLEENPDGDCDMSMNLLDCNHATQKVDGHYRKFHINADNIDLTVKIAA